MDEITLPKRRSIRLLGYDYSQENAYYITVCVDGKRCCLADVVDFQSVKTKYGIIVEEEILVTEKLRLNVEIPEFVIMPNHIHMIIHIKDKKGSNIKNVLPGKLDYHMPENNPAFCVPGSIGAIINQIKGKATKRIREAGNMSFKWQKNYYEHVIRNEEDLLGIREYIQGNPAKWQEDEYNPVVKPEAGRAARDPYEG